MKMKLHTNHTRATSVSIGWLSPRPWIPINSRLHTAFIAWYLHRYRHIISLEMKLALGMRVFSVSGECVLFELAVPLQRSSVYNLKARSLAVWLANPTFSFSVYESSYLIHDSRYQIHRMCWSIKGIRFELQLSSKAFTIYSSVQKGVYIKYVSIFIYFSENVVVVLFVVDIKTDGPSHWNGYFVSIISGIQYLCLWK